MLGFFWKSVPLLFFGFSKDIVDKADTFPQVLRNVIEWMRQRELGTKYSYSMLTDGYVFMLPSAQSEIAKQCLIFVRVLLRENHNTAILLFY